MSAVISAVGVLSDTTTQWVTQATAWSCETAPDGAAVHLEPECGLGFALLRTASRDCDSPRSLDGQVWAAADAHFDDRTTLVGDLRRHGRDVSSDTSDVDLLLHGYATWGEAVLDHLTGEFAFALWDRSRQQLLCARDQVGVAPLYYACIDGALLVASSIDALLLHPAVADDLDDEWVANFLVFGTGNDFRTTVFRGIRRLPAAHLLTWPPVRQETRRYWELPRWEPLVRFSRPEEYVERFRDLLDAAVADRITGDRVALQLSGGLDSTNVAASAVKALRERSLPSTALRAVTGTLGKGSGDQEGDYAVIAAVSLGLDLDTVDAASIPPTAPVGRPVPLTPEPTTFRLTAFQHEVARRSGSHAPVCLTGVAGDSLLWFYPWYWMTWLAHRQVGRLARAAAEQRRLFGGRLHPRIRDGVTAVLAGSRSDEEPPDWMTPMMATRFRKVMARGRRSPLVWADDARSIVDSPHWTVTFDAGAPAVTGLPMRFRHPLVDLRLLRFVASLPPEPWLDNKHILRQVSGERLPQEIRQRPKTGLVASDLPGYEEGVREILADLVRRAPLPEHLVDKTALAAAVRTAAGKGGEWHYLALPLGLAAWQVHRARPVSTFPSQEPPRRL